MARINFTAPARLNLSVSPSGGLTRPVGPPGSSLRYLIAGQGSDRHGGRAQGRRCAARSGAGHGSGGKYGGETVPSGEDGANTGSLTSAGGGGGGGGDQQGGLGGRVGTLPWDGARACQNRVDTLCNGRPSLHGEHARCSRHGQQPAVQKAAGLGEAQVRRRRWGWPQLTAAGRVYASGLLLNGKLVLVPKCPVPKGECTLCVTEPRGDQTPLVEGQRISIP